MHKDPQLFLCEWIIRVEDVLTGEITETPPQRNLVVKDGRELALVDIFGLTASTPVIAGMVGACSTPANVNDTTLVYEHIGNATRKPLTNTSDVALSASDIEDVVYVDPDTGVTFYKKLTVKYKYNTSDGNNDQPFREYGLNTSMTLPATPTSLSGIMLNRLVDGATQTKLSTNIISVFISVYC